MVLSLLQKELMSSLHTCLSAQDLQCYITGHFPEERTLSLAVLPMCAVLPVDRRCPGLGLCVCGLTWAGFHLPKGTEEK